MQHNIGGTKEDNKVQYKTTSHNGSDSSLHPLCHTFLLITKIYS